MKTEILEDVLQMELKIIFCGTAAGMRSAHLGLPYSGRGNKFWPILYEVGFIPERLGPADFRRLPEFGIGLTDMAKTAFGIDSSLAPSDFDRKQFLEKLSVWRPRILAFNGKKAASVFLEKPTRSLNYGRQQDVAEGPILWILPSTSGAANLYWSDLEWSALGRFIERD